MTETFRWSPPVPSFVRRLGLRPKLTALFLTLGLIPVAVCGIAVTMLASSNLEAQSNRQLADLAFNASDKLDRNLFERYGDVQAFANSDPARSMDSARISAFMTDMTRIYSPIYRLMIVASPDGKVIAASPTDLDGKPIAGAKLLGSDVSGETWFKTAVGALRTARPSSRTSTTIPR
jgi:hypothetical protein